jgi:histidine triad (HIT) family protein
MEDCLFCKTYNEALRSNKIIFENNSTYAIFNYKPSTPGHTLIIPKVHVYDFRELEPNAAKLLFDAIPETFDVIKTIYKNNLDELISFYKSIINNPPEPNAINSCKEILEDPLLIEPPVGYNIGINMGYGAGQRECHIHIHLFPRRGNGLGIATAMKNHLKE